MYDRFMSKLRDMPQESLHLMDSRHRYAFLALMLIRFSATPVLLALCFLLPFPQLAIAFVACISVALLAGYAAGWVVKHADKMRSLHRN